MIKFNFMFFFINSKRGNDVSQHPQREGEKKNKKKKRKKKITAQHKITRYKKISEKH